MKLFQRSLFLALACLAAAAVFAMGSKEAPETTVEDGPAQGIAGQVEIWEGNFMPMTDSNSAQNSKTPGAGLRIRVHAPVKMGGAASATLMEVPTPLIAETMTDESGKFFVEVEPGMYSVFVEENGGWYFNGWNGEGIQGAAEVLPGEQTTVNIRVTTNATF
ncbi:carboxypeptidase-like regulatory domain-containing protein [bacterium]|nr:carboxypeptidase-like regulatory domain-containing protein [bacterium]MBU1638185.1 carboxypeptidase-like regulatory domain-containing protein [bacterium]MBU1920509.1 carboxypeptidase-like regulatory domain-containing protein [bacterium]